MWKKLLIVLLFFCANAFGQLAIPMNPELPLAYICTGGVCPFSLNTFPGSTYYQAFFTATGGTSPYAWTQPSGSLPPGVLLTYQSLTLTSVSAPSGGLAVYHGTITGGNSGVFGGRPFLVTGFSNAANNGTFFCSSSSETAGTLTLANAAAIAETHAGAASVGFLSGLPTTAGTYSFTITATDAVAATATKSFSLQVFDQPLDVYGGMINKPCTANPNSTAHFYVAEMSSRWYICTPGSAGTSWAGNAFWMNGMFAVGYNASTDYQGINETTLVNSKYAGGYTTNAGMNWSLNADRRLASWGINTLGIFTYTQTMRNSYNALWPGDHYNPIGLPYIAFIRPSFYALTNSNGYGTKPVKDLTNGIKSSVYNGYKWVTMDYDDPAFGAYLTGEMTGDSGFVGYVTGTYTNYCVGVEVDQEDELGGMGAGPDYPSIEYGAYSPNRGIHYHIGWIALITPATQSSNAGRGVTYTDTTSYTKQALSTFLSVEYGASIVALNAAWGSYYTTFGASGAGWGVGSGLLDEDGLCPSHPAGCWVPQATGAVPPLWKVTDSLTQLQTDLDAFMLAHVKNYFSTVKSILAANTNTQKLLYLGPDSIGSWGTLPRAQILQAISSYADVIGESGSPPPCTNGAVTCPDFQNRIDFMATYGGNKPWKLWQGNMANPDSYMSPYANPSNIITFTSQVARGSWYQNHMIPEMFNAKDTATATYHGVGYEFWAMSDASTGQNANWGFLTGRDDPYDGFSTSPSQGYEAWGYPVGCVGSFGCEEANYGAPYGDFLDYAQSANLWVLDQIGAGSGPVASCTIQASPRILFGSTLVGTSITPTISNVGTATCTDPVGGSFVAALSLTGDYNLDKVNTATPCGATLAVSASCTVTIRPMFKRTSDSGTLVIHTNDPVGDTVVPITDGPTGAISGNGTMNAKHN